MTQLLEWLLGLDHIRLERDAPLLVKWGVAVPPWVLFCIAVVGIGWITIIYRRERVSLRRKLGPAVVRACVAALIVAVLCQPSLVLERDRIEPSHVALLVDTSQSMAARESYVNVELANAVARGAGLTGVSQVASLSRLDLIRAALLRDEATALSALLQHNGTRLCTFAGMVETRGFAASQEGLESLVERIEALRADGRSTDLSGALARTVEDAPGRRLAAVILASDGQTTEPTSLKDALDLASGRQIPILPIRIGSPVRSRDIDVGPVRSEESVFVDDIASVEVQITSSGLSEATPVSVRLIDDQTGTQVGVREVTLDPDEAVRMVELRWRPTKTGALRYRIEVAPLPHEQTTANNAVFLDVRVLDDHLRVLYVEGYPRFEYRYLKNTLLREKTLDLSVLLIEADKDFVQEGTVPIRHFPETPEELSRFDVVLFGDVDPRGGWLTEAQMNMMLDFVGHEGGGFGLIAGERAAPHRFRGTPLEKLIPVRIDPSFLGRYDAPLTSGFSLNLTAEGRRNRLFRFAEKNAQTADDGGAVDNRFEALPDLYWIARTLGPKPGASVLAEHPTTRMLMGPMPVVVAGRYGAGRILFQAIDGTWRWRRHTGELLHDMYWVQMVRELVQSGRLLQDRRFVIRTDRRTYHYGMPILVEVEIFDPQLLELHRDTIEMAVSERESRGENVPTGGTTSPFITDTFEVHRISHGSSLFEGTYVPPHAGSFALKTEDIAPPVGEPTPSVFVRVEQPDLEKRRPEANHDVLERIAESTGGRVIELDQLEAEFETIRDRSVKIPDDITEPLWDSKLVLILFGLLITTEWVMRKAFGML